MKAEAFFTLLFMSLICFLLTVVLLIMGYGNQKEQEKLQTQQQILNQGILGQQAQQISGALLQSLAEAGTKNLEIRQLMEKHGYRINQSTDTSAPAPKEDMKKSNKSDPEKTTSAEPEKKDRAGSDKTVEVD